MRFNPPIASHPLTILSAAIYNVVNNGFSAYTIGPITGAGTTVAPPTDNPHLTLTRGLNYKFQISAGGHPFWIKTVQGSGSSNGYSGFKDQGTETGTVFFTVPLNAPDTLYYNCEYHSAMTGTINIVN